MKMQLIKEIISFHSSLSPLMNIGLITPGEVVEKLKKIISKVKINSLEGYFRQIVGWREFIKGVYQNYDEKFEKSNFFNHKRLMKKVGMMEQQEFFVGLFN